jgi:hypothetical protein
MNPFKGLEDFFGELCTSQMCSAQVCQHPMQTSKRQTTDYCCRKPTQNASQSINSNFRRVETPSAPSVRAPIPAEVKRFGEKESFRVFSYKTESGKLETFSLALLQDERDEAAKKAVLDPPKQTDLEDEMELGGKAPHKEFSTLDGRHDRSSGLTSASQSLKLSSSKRLQDIKLWRAAAAAVSDFR